MISVKKWANLIISKCYWIAGVWFVISLAFTGLAWRSDRFHFAAQLRLEHVSHALAYAAFFAIIILIIDGCIQWRASRKVAAMRFVTSLGVLCALVVFFQFWVAGICQGGDFNPEGGHCPSAIQDDPCRLGGVDCPPGV
jgi:uncharacterized membrane protein (UPF0136 family)